MTAAVTAMKAACARCFEAVKKLDEERDGLVRAMLRVSVEVVASYPIPM
jgi:hypothetical protein